MMLLAFVVVLFGGLGFMFFTILRGQEQIIRAMREEHAVLIGRLDALQARPEARSETRLDARPQGRPGDGEGGPGPCAASLAPGAGRAAASAGSRPSPAEALPGPALCGGSGSAPDRLDLPSAGRTGGTRESGLPDVKI